MSYSPSGWCSLARLRGSVVPRALRWAVPGACLAALYRLIAEAILTDMTSEDRTSAQTSTWTQFTAILGFLLAFRAQQAYQRYWEGLTLVEQASGAWLGAFSSVIAFCTSDPKRQHEVMQFQCLISRMTRLLMKISLCALAESDELAYTSLDFSDLPSKSRKHLDTVERMVDKQKVVLQWTQRLIVERSRTGILDVAPPILTRAFQDLSIGLLRFTDAAKLSAVPFPFPLAQVMWLMLSVFSIVFVPGLCALSHEPHKAAIYTFIILFPIWCVHGVAVEIEMPFGSDPNDLPLEVIQHRFDTALAVLLQPGAQQVPETDDVDMEMGWASMVPVTAVGGVEICEITSAKKVPTPAAGPCAAEPAPPAHPPVYLVTDALTPTTYGAAAAAAVPTLPARLGRSEEDSNVCSASSSHQREDALSTAAGSCSCTLDTLGSLGSTPRGAPDDEDSPPSFGPGFTGARRSWRRANATPGQFEEEIARVIEQVAATSLAPEPFSAQQRRRSSRRVSVTTVAPEEVEVVPLGLGDM